MEPPGFVEVGRDGEAERGIERVPRLAVDGGLDLKLVHSGVERGKLGGVAGVGRRPRPVVQSVAKGEVVGVAERDRRKVDGQSVGVGREPERIEGAGRAVGAHLGHAHRQRVGHRQARVVRIDGGEPARRRIAGWIAFGEMRKTHLGLTG